MFNNGAMFEWALFWLGSACFFLHGVIFVRTVVSSNRVRAMTDPPPSTVGLLVIESNVIGTAILLIVSFVCALSGWVVVSFDPPPGRFNIASIWMAHALIMISVLALTSGLSFRWYQHRILAQQDQQDRRSADRNRRSTDRITH